MEIPAWLFFSFWALISITFLHLGFYALDKTELSKSVSPVVMSFFKHSLAISSCCSSHYALTFPRRLMDEIDILYFWVVCGILSFLYYISIDWPFLWGLMLYILIMFLAWLLDFLPKLKILAGYSLFTAILFFPAALFPWSIALYILLNFISIFGDVYSIPELRIRICIYKAIEISLFFVGGENTMFFPILVVSASFFISAFWAALSGFELGTTVTGSPFLGEESFMELLPVAVKLKEILPTLKEKKIGKLIGYVVGMGATVLFQNFFRLTSFNHVVAFLYLAVMWVANLALLGVSDDLGVFNFLLGNVVVGCTVNQFGLRSTTWLAYGASVLLFGFRLKLESLNLVYGQGERIHITLL